MKKLILLFSFCFFWTLQVEGKEKTICLNMIVKNESKVIKRCLDSVKSIIDYWVIVDTGSIDGTREIIKECMKEVPGQLYEEEWVNFDHNREEALDLAKDKSDYILFMDAKEQMGFSKDFIKPSLEKDFYYIETSTEDVKSNKIKIIKNNLNGQWRDNVYELSQYAKVKTFDTWKSAFITKEYENHKSITYPTNNKDIKTLKEALKKDPNNACLIFDLAKSYQDANKKIKAFKLYSKRISLKENEEEVFLSMLQVANLKRDLGFPIESTINSYYQTHRFRTDRIEPIYFLADIYNHERKFKLAYEIIKAFDFSKKSSDKISSDEKWMNEFGKLYQLSVCTYRLGKNQESLNACLALLSKKNLFKDWREDTKKRLQTLLKRLDNKLYLLQSARNENEINSNEKDNFEYKKVLIAILARNKAHVLPIYLKCIQNLNYDKKYITVYINTNNNTDNTLEILKNWIDKNKDKYRDIVLEHHECEIKNTNPHNWPPERLKLLGEIRNKSLKKTFEYNCDYYFTADCDNFIFPGTLKELIKKDRPIIAPMLRSIPEIEGPYSNYFCEVNEWGYAKSHPDYSKILNREKIGTFKVPVVHCTYLVKSNVIDKLTYSDKTDDCEFVIFSRSARNNNIDQYICNEKDFGLILFRTDVVIDNVTIEDEKKWMKEYLEKY